LTGKRWRSKVPGGNRTHPGNVGLRDPVREGIEVASVLTLEGTEREREEQAWVGWRDR
jgi:hypothetical protein